ncbi:MAG TPA: PAS domain-containing protein [Acidimicrobiales bacterium]|nr:PAS domain-containing protein [Acidimicrobiales bacterium]
MHPIRIRRLAMELRMRRRRLDFYRRSQPWPGKEPAWRSELVRYDRYLVTAAMMLEVPVPELESAQHLTPAARAVLEDRLALAGLDRLRLHEPGPRRPLTAAPLAPRRLKAGRRGVEHVRGGHGSAAHPTAERRGARAAKSWLKALPKWLPRGSTLPHEVWAKRHRGILVVLWLHVPGVFLFSLALGETLLHSVVESSFVGAFAAVATAQRSHRRTSTAVAALGLFTCSAVLVHLSGGVIEMHFHYFVMVGVVTLYQDWQPFLMAIGYVVVQHGLAEALVPDTVYNHQSAIDHPWQWAGVHGLFIVGMSAAGIASWKLNEALIQATAEREEQLSEAQEVAKLGSWEWDVSTGEVTWSRELYRLMGVDPEDFTPFPEAILSLLHPDDRDILATDMRRSLDTGTSYAHDFRGMDPDGTVRWLHARGAVTARDATSAGSCRGRCRTSPSASGPRQRSTTRCRSWLPP